jgi:ribosomal protein L31E
MIGSSYMGAAKKTKSLTIRILASKKSDWSRRAAAAGISVSQYISRVMDHTEIVVSMRSRRPGKAGREDP